MSKYFWQSEHVCLRLEKPSDYEAKYREFCDSHTRRLLEDYVELPKSISDYKKSYEKPIDEATYERMIPLYIDNNEGEFVGWLNLFISDKKNGVFRISFGTYPEYRGKGYAYEASVIALRYAFTELGFQKCNSSCLSINPSSKRLHEKLGFVNEGLVRRVTYTNGEYCDLVLFGLLKEEFMEKFGNKK